MLLGVPGMMDESVLCTYAHGRLVDMMKEARGDIEGCRRSLAACGLWTRVTFAS